MIPPFSLLKTFSENGPFLILLSSLINFLSNPENALKFDSDTLN